MDKYNNDPINRPFVSPHENMKRTNWDPPTPHDISKWKSQVPKTPTIEDLFPKIDRWSVGFDGVFDMLKRFNTTGYAVPSFPPYDITKFDGGKWQIDLALAGFRKEDINITVQDNMLTIASDVKQDEPEGEVIHHGLAKRNFTSKFALAEHVEIEEAKMEDGILTIKLVTNLPEEKKPKTIDIK